MSRIAHISAAGGAGAGGPTTVVGTYTPDDAEANPTDAVPAESFTMFWNNGSWKRWRVVPVGIPTGFEAPTVGLTAVGGFGISDTGGIALGAAQFDPFADSLQINDASGVGGLYTIDLGRSLNNATANFERARVASGDAMAATGLRAGVGMLWNGATWDRPRSGTATGSVLVNNPTAANLLVTATLDAASLAALETVTVNQGTPDGTASGWFVKNDWRLNTTSKQYMISLTLPGVAGAGTNLLGLRKLLANADVFIKRIRVQSYAVAATGAVPSDLRLVRATTVAGGTLIAAADIPKLDTAAANATLEVRTGAATGTEAAQALMRMIASTGTPSATASVPVVDFLWEARDMSERIRLTGDEGLILDQVSASDADVRYAVQIVWEEA